MIRPLGAAAAGVVAYLVTFTVLYLAWVEFATMWILRSPSAYLLAAVAVLQVLAAATAGGLAGWIQDSTAPRWQSWLVILLAPVLLVLVAIVVGSDPRAPLWYHALSVVLVFAAAGAAGSAALTRLGP